MASRHQPFVLPDTTPRSSRTVINIAGFHVYLYGIRELSTAQANETTVLFHIHGRTRTYRDAEELAHQLLFDIERRGPTRRGLVVAALDNRNHGTRAIDTIASQDWKGGNTMHAQDLLSMTDGAVFDIQTIVKYLETYVDGMFVPTRFIATGLSLGGHAAWNLLAEEPRIINAIIIVGSPNLTDLLRERFEAYRSDSGQAAGDWPRSILKLYQERDERMKQITGKKILILNGAEDVLVPSKFTRPWLESYAGQNDVTFMEFEETGHGFSCAMMDTVSDWIWHLQREITPQPEASLAEP